jgi:hypothetical protein
MIFQISPAAAAGNRWGVCALALLASCFIPRRKERMFSRVFNLDPVKPFCSGGRGIKDATLVAEIA